MQPVRRCNSRIETPLTKRSLRNSAHCSTPTTSFLLALDRAPVAIGLTWALILIGAMRLTDALGVRRRQAQHPWPASAEHDRRMWALHGFG